MTIKKKILIGYGVAFALMGLVVVWAIINLLSLGRATDAILSENYLSILAAENMVDILERQNSGLLLMYLEEAEDGVKQFRENEAIFMEWLTRAKANITIQGESELLQSIETRYADYRKQFFSMIDRREIATTSLAADHYQQEVYPFFLKVREACIGLRNLNEETMYAASVRAGKIARRAIGSTALVAALALIVVMWFSWFLADRIVRPIRHFMEAARKIASGDYAVQVTVATTDELGLLAAEFNRMAQQLDHYHELNIEQIIAEKNKGEAILASIEDSLVVFDPSLRVTGINPAARRLLALESSQNADLGCPDILPVPQVCDLIRRSVETGVQPEIPDEQRIITLPGSGVSRHFLYSVTTIRGRDRKLSGIVLLLRDVTRLKEVERLKSEFVMAASHELRTPLTSLGMAVDLLLEHTAPGLAEKDRDLLQTAQEEVHRMKALVSDLLDLSKMETGRIELEFERVAVQTLFDHVETVFRGQMTMKEVSLIIEPLEAVLEVRADATKITWVLTNLISNALRYVNKGGQILLSACRTGSLVHLSVKDDGPGIPPEFQTKIFRKFVQLKGQEAGGTGLGLSICKEIVSAHGGTIWVESTTGRGSTFTFTLPTTQ